MMWAMVLIGAFYVMTTALGFGARAILGQGGEEAAGADRQPRAAARWPTNLGGELFLAIIAGVAFATILAVVAGLVISASGAVAHDVWSNIVRRGRDSEKEEVWVAKIAARRHRRDRDRHRRHRRRGPERLVHGRPRVRGGGQRQLPGAAAGADLAALQHHRRRHRRAGRRDQLDRARDHQPDGVAGAGLRGRRCSRFYDLANPGIISIPLGFIGCWLGTMLAREPEAERRFDELYVRSETGLGAEVGTGLTLTGRGERRARAGRRTRELVGGRTE